MTIHTLVRSSQSGCLDSRNPVGRDFSLPVPVPTNLQIIESGDDWARITWSTSPFSLGYNVYVNDEETPRVVSYVDNFATVGSLVQGASMRVSSFNSAGESLQTPPVVFNA